MTFSKRLTPGGRKMLAFLTQHKVPTQSPTAQRYIAALSDKRISDADLLAAMLMAHYHTWANGNTTLVASALRCVTELAGYDCHKQRDGLALLQALVPPLSASLTNQRPKPVKVLREEAADIASTLLVAEMTIAGCRSECTPLFSLESLFDSCL